MYKTYTQINNKTKIIEQNHLGHFCILPKHLGFSINTVDEVIIINCNMPKSMFNIAYGSPKKLKKTELLKTIKKIKQSFSGNPFAWWIPPSQKCLDIKQCLIDCKFSIESPEYPMILDLSNLNSIDTQSKTNLKICSVKNHTDIEDFIIIIQPYDSYSQNFYKKLPQSLLENDFFIENLLSYNLNNKNLTSNKKNQIQKENFSLDILTKNL